jgi:hypothetical protein
MASTLTVRPSHADLLVRNPDAGMKPLAKDGEAVPDTEYWRRRLKDGDVVEVKPETKPAAASAAKK